MHADKKVIPMKNKLTGRRLVAYRVFFLQFQRFDTRQKEAFSIRHFFPISQKHISSSAPVSINVSSWCPVYVTHVNLIMRMETAKITMRAF